MNKFVSKIVAICLINAALCACGMDRGGIDVQQPDPPSTTHLVADNGSAVAGKIDSVDSNSNVVAINGDSLNVAATAIVIN